MIPFLAGLVGVVVVLGGVVLAVSGLARVSLGRTPQLPEVRPALVRTEGLTRVVLSPLPVLTGWVAVPIAERRNDWVDEDGNGMLDPFANGQYDWMDLNGGDWLLTWGLMNAVLAVGAVVLLTFADQRLNAVWQ